jgi:hypothetical protein
MTERSYQDAVQVLKDRLGGQWEGAQTDGRDEMARILRKELGYDHRTAEEAISAMIDAGTLRYHNHAHVDGDADDVDESDVVAPVGLGMAAGAPVAGSMGGVPLVPAMIGAGHWEIGPGDSDELGRKGQVTPR